MDHYIYTEIINCGKIGKIALKSFNKYHDLPVHVYGTTEDFKWIDDSPNIVKHNMDKEFLILNGFYEGHKGTSLLWAKIIQEANHKFLIHFDSDVIFRAPLINEIIEKTNSYDLVGPVRNYKFNPFGHEYAHSLPDVVHTDCFAFNRELIGKYDYYTLANMCRGMYNPHGHPVIDFFDPVSFDIIYHGGKVAFLEHDDVGACSPIDGKRDNIFKEYNNDNTPFKIDFGRKLVHFSAVGSGMNFYNKGKVDVPEGYIKYAIDRYALFCKIFYNEDLGFDLSQYSKLLGIESWY